MMFAPPPPLSPRSSSGRRSSGRPGLGLGLGLEDRSEDREAYRAADVRTSEHLGLHEEHQVLVAEGVHVLAALGDGVQEQLALVHHTVEQHLGGSGEGAGDLGLGLGLG
eukprot:scaffold73853_cov50-Phaeocystis_antarctica.AAC.4